MKAVILVGGEGTRLRPLTCNVPKAMVPILNRPFMEHLLGYLKKHGIREVILAMGYLPEPIQGYYGDGAGLGLKLTYMVEDEPLGTAGAVKNAESLLDDTFIVFNGDILTEIDLTAMVRRHREIKPRVSIALTLVDNPTMFGVVETDDAGMVQRFVEKPSWDQVTSNMINAGIYIVEPDVLEYVPPSTPWMFEKHLFPLLLQKGEPVMGYPSEAYWIDIGTPEQYLKANNDLLLNWKDKQVRFEGNSQVHPTARIEGPALIGAGCDIAADVKIKGPAAIGPGCRIGKGSVIEGSVLWEGSRLAEETVLKNCVVGYCGCVEDSCRVLEECIIGSHVTVKKGSVLTSGSKIWPEGYGEPGPTRS